jgi:hypothetical protein
MKNVFIKLVLATLLLTTALGFSILSIQDNIAAEDKHPDPTSSSIILAAEDKHPDPTSSSILLAAEDKHPDPTASSISL